MMPLPLPGMVLMDLAGNWLSVRIAGKDYGMLEPKSETATHQRARYHAAGMLPLPPEVLVMYAVSPTDMQAQLNAGSGQLGPQLVPEGDSVRWKEDGPPLVIQDDELIDKSAALERRAWEAKRRG